jgi:hypothetical protein
MSPLPPNSSYCPAGGQHPGKLVPASAQCPTYKCGRKTLDHWTRFWRFCMFCAGPIPTGRRWQPSAIPTILCRQGEAPVFFVSPHFIGPPEHGLKYPYCQTILLQSERTCRSGGGDVMRQFTPVQSYAHVKCSVNSPLFFSFFVLLVLGIELTACYVLSR